MIVAQETVCFNYEIGGGTGAAIAGGGEMMEKLQATVKDIIEQETIKNLLSAQKQIAENGGSNADLIRVTKYLLRLAKKFGNVLVDVIPECNQERRSDPVNEL